MFKGKGIHFCPKDTDHERIRQRKDTTLWILFLRGEKKEVFLI